MPRRFALSLILALMIATLPPSPADGLIKFNGGAVMTVDGSYTASKKSPGGGVILHVTGTFDGASVALEVNGGAAWVASDTCGAMTEAQICRTAVGPVDLRITISSAGTTSISVVGFEAQAVVASASELYGFELSFDGTSSTISSDSSPERVHFGETAASIGRVTIGAQNADNYPALGIRGSIFPQNPAIAFFNPPDGVITSWVGPTGEWTSKVYHAVTGDFNATWAAETGISISSYGIDRIGATPFMYAGVSDIFGPTYVSASSTTDNAENKHFLGIDENDDWRFAIEDDGVIRWGAAGTTTTAGMDTNLYRSAVNVLATDDAMSVAGCVSHGSFTGSAPTGAECDTFYDSDVGMLCVHNGTSFVQLADGSTPCT